MTNESEPNRLASENARLRGDLLTVATRVSHDLRAPLGGILSAAEALRETIGEDSGAGQSLVRSLVISADELAKIVKDVSFVLKATAHPLPKETLKMEGVVACALQRVEYRTVKSGATIAQPASWPAVKGVSAWLEQMWSIFLDDGLNRSGNSPKIEIGWHEAGGEKIFWLRGGKDIPPEQRAGLFQPFDSLHRTDSVGMLNYAMALRLAELQGGRCGCGDDSSIFFTLPV